MQGIDHLSEEIAHALAQDVEYRVREVIQEGIKFALHGHRTVLTTEDVNRSLRLLNIEGLYGFSDSLEFVRAAGPNQDLFFLPDEELDTRKMLRQELTNLPTIPVDPSFQVHWLAIEGTQPLVPENPLPEDITKKLNRKRRRERYLARHGGMPGKKDPSSGTSTASSSSRHVEKKSSKRGFSDRKQSSSADPTVVKHVLSKELIHYFEVISDAVRGFSLVAEDEAGEAAAAAALEEEQSFLAGMSAAEREARRQEVQQIEDERQQRQLRLLEERGKVLGALKKSEASWSQKQSAGHAPGEAVASGMDVDDPAEESGGSDSPVGAGLSSAELLSAQARRDARQQTSSAAASLLRAALESLSTDAGLQSLVPYFVDFLIGEVPKQMQDTKVLSALMYLTKALLYNPNLNLELYLPRIMPPILTCLLGHPLCPNPATNEEHWTLRNLAGTVVGLIVQKFCPSHRNLEAKLCHSLIQFVLDPNSTLPARYGALIGIGHLREEKIRSLLLCPYGDSNAKFLQHLLQEEASDPTASSVQKRCVSRCSTALLLAVNSYFRKAETSILRSCGSGSLAQDDSQRKRMFATLAENSGLLREYEEMKDVFPHGLAPLRHNEVASFLESVMV